MSQVTCHVTASCLLLAQVMQDLELPDEICESINGVLRQVQKESVLQALYAQVCVEVCAVHAHLFLFMRCYRGAWVSRDWCSGCGSSCAADNLIMVCIAPLPLQILDAARRQSEEDLMDIFEELIAGSG